MKYGYADIHFLSILNQMEFHLVQNQKENCINTWYQYIVGLGNFLSNYLKIIKNKYNYFKVQNISKSNINILQYFTVYIFSLPS